MVVSFTISLVSPLPVFSAKIHGSYVGNWAWWWDVKVSPLVSCPFVPERGGWSCWTICTVPTPSLVSLHLTFSCALLSMKSWIRLSQNTQMIQLHSKGFELFGYCICCQNVSLGPQLLFKLQAWWVQVFLRKPDLFTHLLARKGMHI